MSLDQLMGTPICVPSGSGTFWPPSIRRRMRKMDGASAGGVKIYLQRGEGSNLWQQGVAAMISLGRKKIYMSPWLMRAAKERRKCCLLIS